MRSLRQTSWVGLLAAVGCGGGGDEPPDASPEPATVQIELVNNTSAAALWHDYPGNETPDELAVKLIAVTLEDPVGVDPSTAGSQLIYLHPDCDGLDGCGVEAGDGVTSVIADYLELQRSSDEVNAELGATAFTVPAGAYTRVQLRWRRDGSEAFNARYRMDSWQAGAVQEFSWGPPASAATHAQPIEIDAGASLALTLAYKLDQLVLHNQSIDGCEVTGAPNCYEEGQDRWFIVGDPVFGASVRAID